MRGGSTCGYIELSNVDPPASFAARAIPLHAASPGPRVGRVGTPPVYSTVFGLQAMQRAYTHAHAH